MAKWLPDGAVPGRPETNGLIESKVKLVVNGGRNMLVQAGLPERWWPYAVKCFCFGRNVSVDPVTTDSPWQKRHESTFKGQLYPFGCLVDFKPTPVKQEIERSLKFAPKSEPGIFLGYHLHPGGRWRGEYLVLPHPTVQRPRG